MHAADKDRSTERTKGTRQRGGISILSSTSSLLSPIIALPPATFSVLRLICLGSAAALSPSRLASLCSPPLPLQFSHLTSSQKVLFYTCVRQLLVGPALLLSLFSPYKQRQRAWLSGRSSLRR